MNRLELENIKILVNEYDVDSQIFIDGKLMKQYYGGVIYDYTTGAEFCIVDRKMSSYEAGIWNYSILTQEEIQTKIINRESFNLAADRDDGDFNRAYFYPKSKTHIKPSEEPCVKEYYRRRGWLNLDNK